MFKPPLVAPKVVQLKSSATAKNAGHNTASEKMIIAGEKAGRLAGPPRFERESEKTGELFVWVTAKYKVLEVIIFFSAFCIIVC